MLSKVVSIGNRIDIVIKKARLEDADVSYPSKIYDIISNDRLVCAMPIHNNKLVLLATGTRFELYLYSTLGMYRCKAVISDRYKENNVYLFEVELLSEPEKHQRRQYYRMETLLDIKYKPFSEEEYEEYEQNGIISGTMEEKNYVNGTTVDISGGGMKFVSKEQLEPGVQLYCILTVNYLGIEYNIGIVGNILTSVSVINRSGFYEHRMEYMTINGNEREIIIKYIFEEERKKRKNRKA